MKVRTAPRNRHRALPRTQRASRSPAAPQPKVDRTVGERMAAGRRCGDNGWPGQAASRLAPPRAAVRYMPLHLPMASTIAAAGSEPKPAAQGAGLSETCGSGSYQLPPVGRSGAGRRAPVPGAAAGRRDHRRSRCGGVCETFQVASRAHVAGWRACMPQDALQHSRCYRSASARRGCESARCGRRATTCLLRHALPGLWLAQLHRCIVSNRFTSLPPLGPRHTTRRAAPLRSIRRASSRFAALKQLR